MLTSLDLIEGALIQASVQAAGAPAEEVQSTLDYARAQLLEIRDAPVLMGCFE